MSLLYRVAIGHSYNNGASWHTTEFVQLEVGKALTRFGLAEATVSNTVGYWKGVQEPSTIVELVLENQFAGKESALTVYGFAEYLRVRLNQEAILVTTTSVAAILLTAGSAHLD